MIRKLTLLGAAALTAVFGLAEPVHAQWAPIDKGALAAAAPEPYSEPQTWGTVSETVVTYFGHDFHLVEGVELPWDPVTAGRSCGQGSCYWLAGVNLPNGAQIRSIEVSACDSDAAGLAAFALARENKVPSAPVFLVPYTGTGVIETPGCSTFVVNLATPHTVDNAANIYGMVVAADTGNIQWNQYRIRYRLQVSPAPATATFTDVPVGSSQHRFVEALAAAGITGGCGGGNYCPDSPVTRGQMAVFLSVALGLHFPN